MHASSRLGSLNDPFNAVNMNFPILSQTSSSTNSPPNLANNNMNMGKKNDQFPQYDPNINYGISLFQEPRADLSF